MIEPHIHIASAVHFADTAAEHIAAAIRAVVSAQGVCRMALAGGGTPVPIYRALTRIVDVPWSAVELLWGDERAVPPGDDGSNFAMVKQALVDALPCAPKRVLRIHGELGAEQAARAYTDTLGDEPVDVVLLGMGGDGHTASIFPGPGGGHGDVAGPRVIATTSPKPPHDRISLSIAAINEAGRVYLLVAGAGKAGRLAEVRDQIRSGKPTLPAARVQPTSTQLFWLVDRDAASQL